ncbi:MAG: hypothetical protein IJP17_02035 [Clostridia bacterium]|nr:hypothetical protein [Clostridia bacterium]
MKYIILDMEWNGSPYYYKEGYFNEIIEIGAVRLDEGLQLVDTFQALVRPTVHKRLTGRVKRLTHISNNEVRLAKNFVETYRSFCEWVGDEENCFLSYGTGDVLVLLENFEQFNMPQKLSVMDHYCDLQELCKRALGMDKAKQPGLSAVAEAVGIPCDDMDMHRALDDSKVSADCMRKLWNEDTFRELCCVADAEFIRKLTFKSVLLSDIDNPLIDKSVFARVCPECGAPLERTTEIISKNRTFIAHYYCQPCDAEYVGKHQFKLKYEGVFHKCNLRKIVIEPEESDEACDRADSPECAEDTASPIEQADGE